MKTIRCCFTDFWPGFNPEDDFCLLYKKYTILLDDKNPDYVIYSCFGNNHLKYKDRVKIYLTHENDIPDFNLCDYAIGYSSLTYVDRYIRQHNAWNDRFVDFTFLHSRKTPEELLDRKFCNFVYSNNANADPMRKSIFDALSQYKRVDSGGEFLNNIGYRVKKKIPFLSQYKFTLAIENSSFPGYTTEKILHPFTACSVPIYWGNSEVSKDYHPDSFIHIKDSSCIEEAIEEIIRLDNDDAAYLAKLTAPFWPYGDSFEDFIQKEQGKFIRFFQNIFDQPLEKAMRRTIYGRASHYFLPPHTSFPLRVKNKLKRML